MIQSNRHYIICSDNDACIKYVIQDGSFWFVLADIRYAAGCRPGANYIQEMISPENIRKTEVSRSGCCGQTEVLVVNLAGLKEYKKTARKRSTIDVIEYIERWVNANPVPVESNISDNTKIERLESRVNQLTPVITDLVGIVSDMSERLRVLSDRIDHTYLKD